MPLVTLRSRLVNLKAKKNRNVSTDISSALNNSVLRKYITLDSLETKLLSLQFGNDRPGYGSSGLPYIKTALPEDPKASSVFNNWTIDPGTTGNLDYPIRGGNVEFQIGQQTFTLSNKIDSARIRAFFSDSPRGPLFIQKQIGLQLTNPKIETGNTLFSAAQASPLPGLLENTRVYNNGSNTLAQVGVSGTGAHAIRHGLVPFALSQKHYYAIVNQQNVEDDGKTNRLLNLNGLKMTSGVSPFVNPSNVFDLNTINNLGISLNRNLLFQYLGGPGSSYGIGATIINRAVDTTQLGVTNKRWASRNAMIYNELKSQDINKTVDGSRTTNIQDYLYTKKLLKNDPIINRMNQLSRRINNIKKRNKGNSTKLSDKLQNQYNILSKKLNNNKEPINWVTEDTLDYRFYTPYKVDKLNKLFPVIFNNSENPWDVTTDANSSTDDIIKFVFEAIDNDNPSFSVALFFRAFLTSGINDSNSATWNSFKYMGRGENFYTYQGFDRSIAFAFRVYAGSDEELIPMYNRLNALVSQVYPDYSSDGIMRAPIIRMTIGDYINRMYGFLESVDLSVANDYAWETKDYRQLPKIVDVSVKFKPILNELPRKYSLNKFQVEEINTDKSITTRDYINGNAPQIIANNDYIISNDSLLVNSSTKIYEQQDPEIETEPEEIDQEIINDAREASSLRAEYYGPIN